MKILSLYRLVFYHFLSSLVVFLLVETNGASGRSDVKTKLILQNIRTRLAQKADEIVKKKECESGLIFCKAPRAKEGEEEKSEEILPPPKIGRGQHKPAVRVSPKDVIQTFIPKAHKSVFRKPRKIEENKNHKKVTYSSTTEQASDESKEDISDEGKPHKTSDVEEVKKPTKILKPLKPEPPSPIPILKPPKKEEKPRSDAKLPKVTKVSAQPEHDPGDDKKHRKKVVKLEEPKGSLKTIEKKKELKSGKVKDKKKEVTADERTAAANLDFLPGTLTFVLDSDDFENNLCGKHSKIYLKQLKKYQIWALMMYDASAKITSGFLQGNVNQYGDFDECLAINAVFKNIKNKSKTTSGIKGKYCLANLDVKASSESRNLHTAIERAESFQFIKSSIHDPGHFIPRFSTINWGLCVPSTCLAEDVQKFLKYRLEGFNFTGLLFDVNVEEDNCVVKDDLKFKFQTGTLMVILFYIVVLGISLCATFIDAKADNKAKRRPPYETHTEFQTELATAEDNSTQDKTISSGNDEGKSITGGKTRRLLMAFSLKKNVEKLLSDSNRGEIDCINGIKSVFTIMLYFAHKTIPLGMTPFSNRIFLTKISNQPTTILLRASIIYTDSFLLISGMLTSYNLAKEISMKRKISWAKKSIARFIRLTPALLAVILFYGYIWDLMGSGPVWNLLIKKNSSLCRKYLWRNLLYIQNLFAFEDMCAPQTHQLALDMQLSLLAPLFVHLMHIYDKTGVGILQALFILSSILRYITASNNNLSVVIYHGMSVSQLYKTANLLYGQPFHRASPYILGTVVGYYLKKFEKRFVMPKFLAVFGWILFLIFGFYSVVAPSNLALRVYQYDVQEAAQYAALSPVAWSLALSWFIVACHFGFGGILNDFLRQRIFLVFSRISYSVYLTQFLVFFYKVGVTRIPELFTFSGSFNVLELCLVIGISVIVTLLFDIPMMEIKRIILDERAAAEPSEDDLKGEATVQPTDSQKEDESELISGEDSQQTTDDLVEPNEDEDEYEDEEPGEEGAEDEEDEGEEGSDENVDDDESEVFEVRPLRRSMRMHFSDDSEDKKFFKIEPDVDENEQE